MPRPLRLTPARAAPWPLAALLLIASLAPADCGVRLLDPGDDMMPLPAFPQSLRAAGDKAPKRRPSARPPSPGARGP